MLEPWQLGSRARRAVAVAMAVAAAIAVAFAAGNAAV